MTVISPAVLPGVPNASNWCGDRTRRTLQPLRLKAINNLSPPRLKDITTLQTLLRIPPSAYSKVRPVEVATILRQQLEEILADAVIDRAEDLYQVELQAIFGLGYDEYLRMTRVVFERVWDELQQEAALQHVDRAALIHVKITAIEPIVRLALAQPRSTGALYT